MSADDVRRKNLVDKICRYCEAPFKGRPDRLSRFCSRSCATASRNEMRGSGLTTTEVHRRYFREKFYGLTHEDFTELWDEQNGLCAICEFPMVNGGNTRNSCHIDHCHDTGQVRGVLCHSCNMGLGKFYDNPELLNRAAKYIGDFLEGRR